MTRSDMHGFEVDTLAVAWQNKRLWLIQFLINAGLFFAFFGWLRMADQRAINIAVSAILAILIACSALWLHGGTLAHFVAAHRQPGGSIRSSFRQAVGHIPAFGLWVIIFAIILWLVDLGWQYNEQFAGYFRHLLPGPIRSNVSPRSVAEMTSYVLWFVFWILVPGLFFPFGTQTAARGFHGFVGASLKGATRTFCHLRYWGVYVICYVVGIWLPWKLAWMVPRWNSGTTLRHQSTNAGIRFLLAYALLVTAWFILTTALGRLARDPAPEASVELADMRSPISGPPASA